MSGLTLGSKTSDLTALLTQPNIKQVQQLKTYNLASQRILLNFNSNKSSSAWFKGITVDSKSPMAHKPWCMTYPTTGLSILLNEGGASTSDSTLEVRMVCKNIMLCVCSTISPASTPLQCLDCEWGEQSSHQCSYRWCESIRLVLLFLNVMSPSDVKLVLTSNRSL